MTDINIARNKPKVNFGQEKPPPTAASGATPPSASDTSGPSEQDIRQTRESWDRVIRGIVYALALFLPILFTPWTFEPLQFSKQMLLFVLTSAAAIAWILKLLVLREIRLVKTPLDLPIGIFLIIYLVASIFSIDRVASFLGFYGSFHGNFFQVLFLILLYYIIVNNFDSPRKLRKLIGIFIFSLSLAYVFILLQFFGWFIVPFSFAKVSNFNTIGSLLGISLLAAFGIVLSLGARGKSWFDIFSGRIWRIILMVLAFVVLLTVNFIYAWVALLVGLLLYLIFQIAISGKFSMKDFLTPLVLVIVTIAFLVIQLIFPAFSLRNILSFDVPAEVRLDYKTAAPVLTGAVKDRPIFGLGPNTFLYAFSQYRAQDFNLSPFWNVRFDRAPSEAAEYLVGSGILGLLAFEILNLIFIIYGLFYLFRSRDKQHWSLALAVFSAFGTLWLAHWFFFFNTVSTFSLWLMMGSFMVLSRPEAVAESANTKAFSLADNPRQTVSIVSAASLTLVLVVVFIFFAIAAYASDIFYRQGLAASGSVDTYDEAQTNFERAIRLNRFRPDYYLTYGEFLFTRINAELAKPDPNLGQIQSWLAASINTSRAAVDLSPANWTAWERLANLYAFARPLVAGVDDFIIDSLTRATENDSKNPILFVELGQIHRLASRQIDASILGRGADSDSDALTDEQERVLGSDPADPDTNGNNVLDGDEVLNGLNPAGSGVLPESFLANYLKSDPASLLRAEDALRKAVELKDDYAVAYYQLALTLEEQGKLDQAIVELERALQKLPSDINLKFELGRMYYNSGKVNEAARQFQEVISIAPNHSNARFSLALTHERLGRLQRALDEYRRVLELNPGNSAIEQKITQLEGQINAQPQE